MQSKKQMDINLFSAHLFWDLDKENKNIPKNKNLIIRKVLLYGLIDDWKMIYKYYGIDEIISVAKKMKELDERTLALLSLLSKTPKEEFLCYTTKQLTPQHWNF